MSHIESRRDDPGGDHPSAVWNHQAKPVIPQGGIRPGADPGLWRREPPQLRSGKANCEDGYAPSCHLPRFRRRGRVRNQSFQSTNRAGRWGPALAVHVTQGVDSEASRQRESGRSYPLFTPPILEAGNHDIEVQFNIDDDIKV